MQQRTMIQSVGSRVMMAIQGLGLKQGDVNTMELGVDKTSLAKVCKTYCNKDLSNDYIS